MLLLPAVRRQMIVLALGSAGALAATTASNVNYTQYVDPFFGSENGGNVFPGVVPAPFSMVKLGIDVSSGTTDAYSGYLPSGNVTGFSMMHESGTGGAPKYGVVSQLPVVGNISNPLAAELAVSRRVPDQAQVGYYRTELSNAVVVQLAATNHAGLYQYQFPESSVANVVVDVSHVLPSYRGLGWEQHYSGGSFQVFDDGHYEGNGTYNGGWNLSPDWTIHFCGRFDKTPRSQKTFSGNGTRIWEYGAHDSVSGTQRVGGVFSFNESHVVSRVGISFLSSERACSHIDYEIPASTTLSELVQQAQETWTSNVFSKVTTTETNATLLTQLYSSLYGMHLLPSNRTGENPHWESTEPYYDDWFTLWDLFRCTTPLMHILQPEAYEEQIRSFIDIWRHDGFLPDARSSNYNGRVQGGSNADNVLADAYVKGVRGQVDWFDGIEAMLADAKMVPAPSYDPLTAPDISSTKEGRGALPDWLKYGYITPSFSRAVSRAVEYSVNDFAIYQVLNGMNDSELDSPSDFLNRSRNWRNHWNPSAHSSKLNESGFVVPRAGNGSFLSQDPDSCGGCYWPDAYYEDNAWTYSFNAHHDAAQLISLSGGPAAFAARLDKFFDGGIYNVANEPGFTTPYLYNFAGAQHRTVARIRAIAQKSYGTGPSALPGNSDAGAMQSWLLWNMLGLYPLTGQTTFLIGSPWFANVSVALGGGRFLNVSTNVGHDDQVQSGKWFVQSLSVNGNPWTQNWLTWEDVFAHGAELVFELDSVPNSAWERGAPLPPSPAT
ncbi:putative alpha-1,2-mannosidase [Phyllosticta citricarpa]